MGILFIVVITGGVGYLVHLAAEGKVMLIDGKIILLRSEEASSSLLASLEEKLKKESKASNVGKKEWIKRERFYGRQIVRRNPKRVKGEIRKKKVTIKGFGK